MKWRLVAIVSIRTICLLTVAFLSARLIPYAGNFPYRDLLISYNLSQVLYSWANFDGAHYINIARDGYHQFDQAFFPLYPLMIRALGGSSFCGIVSILYRIFYWYILFSKTFFL